MIKTFSIDLEKPEYTKYFNAIKQSLANKPLPSSESADFYFNLKNRLALIFPVDYILIMSDSIEYNIQTVKNSSWIFSIYSARIIAYRPKPVSFPQLLKCPPLTKEDTKEFLVDNKDPLVTSMKLIKNTLLNPLKEQHLMDLVKLILNKIGGDKEPIGQMLVYVKQFCLVNVESLFVHMVVGNRDTFEISYSGQIGELEISEKIFELDFKLKGIPTKKKLVIFEKQGQVGTFSQRFSDKWKQVLLVMIFIGALLLLTKCNNGSTEYLGRDIQGICKNKNMLIYLMASIFVGFIFIRHWSKSKERIKEMKAKKAV